MLELADVSLAHQAIRQPSLWEDDSAPRSEAELIQSAIALAAQDIREISPSEIRLITGAAKLRFNKKLIPVVREQIRDFADPLGAAFCEIRSSEQRRSAGATYTPLNLVRHMVNWAASFGRPDSIIDPGVGSARFLIAAGKEFPNAQLLGVDIDPLATLIARANLATIGFHDRSAIFLQDFRLFPRPGHGRVLFIGNPPYVRHHHIPTRWKDWLREEANKHGIHASKLAGLHLHFFLRTAAIGKPGDYGVFVTAAEWLDVNYGALMRSLALNGLGVRSISVLNAASMPFPDAATTAAITTFEIGSRQSRVFVNFPRSITELPALDTGAAYPRSRLAQESRWSALASPPTVPHADYVELGEICGVHRGQVTGANHIWIEGDHTTGLPESVFFPSVTRAREIIAAAGVLDDAFALKRVVDLPSNLDRFNDRDRVAIDKFLRVARSMGGNKGYVATHRAAWWSVGLKPPAPILATYMARRPPAFALNSAHARHINIAHGLYPRLNLSVRGLTALVEFLRHNVALSSGRTYAGGLVKFEPGEMERILVPKPEILESSRRK